MVDTLILRPPAPASWSSPPITSVLVPLVSLVAQGVPEVLVGVEGAGELVDVVVGADGAEVLHVVPEVRGGEGPVGHGWWLVIRHCRRSKGHWGRILIFTGNNQVLLQRCCFFCDSGIKISQQTHNVFFF